MHPKITVLNDQTTLWEMKLLGYSRERVTILKASSTKGIPNVFWSTVMSAANTGLLGGLLPSCCSASKSCPVLYDPWAEAHQAPLSSTVPWNLLKFMSIESVMLCNRLIFCIPFSSCPQSSQHQVFSNELALHIRWPKYWSFSFSISPSNEYSGLISFRIDWFDLLAVQGTLKSLLQLQFFGIQSINSLAFSHLYGPTLTSVDDYWKNHSFD